MKILVVDDSREKLAKVVSHLVDECSVARDNIAVRYTAASAREVLKVEAYDLLILDILLPLRDEDEPSAKTSADLLAEIKDRDTLRRPQYIIGLTAHEPHAGNVADGFQDRVWSVVHYNSIDTNWKVTLTSLIEYLKRRALEKANLSYDLDVCIVTALQGEMDAIHRIDWTWEPPVLIDDNTYVRYGTIPSGGKRYRVATAVAPRMGMVATSLLCAKLISKLRPRFIVMAGICAGVEGKTNIGDVILADSSWDWQSGKHTTDELGPHFSFAPHQLPLPEFVRSRCSQLRSDHGLWSKIKHDYLGSAPSTELTLRLGPMASGSAVLADSAIVKQIQQQERNLLGVEMEIYGMYAAASSAGFPRPTAIAMKAVCDYGDKGKNDDHQRYAMFTSAQAVKAFLSNFLTEIHSLAGT